LVAIDGSRVTASVKNVGGIPVHEHLDWRIDYLERIRREGLAGVNARARRAETRRE
jgi:hypothetical protein